MSRSPHPLLDRLHYGAGTASQWLAGAQTAEAALAAIVGGLPRVGFDVPDAWSRLLELPLDARQGAVQSALDRLAAAQPPALAPAWLQAPGRAPAPTRVQAPAPRAAGAALGNAETPPARAAADTTPARTTRRPARAGAPADFAPARSPAVPALTPQAAAATWRQRAAAAGPAVEDAYFSVLRPATPARAGAPQAPPPRASLLLQTGAAARADATAGAGVIGANAAAAPTSATALPIAPLPRLEAVLARIEQRRAAPPLERLPPAARDGRGDAAPRQAADPRLPTRHGTGIDAPGATAPRPSADGTTAAHWAAANAAAARGFRGLAARAAAAAASGPRRAITAAPDAPLPAPDDDDLVEQFTRVLKRQAERDGIDTSDTAP